MHSFPHSCACIPGWRWLLHKHKASACLYDSPPRGCGPAAQTASSVSCPGMAQALSTRPAACHTQSTCCQAQCSCRPSLVVSGRTWQTEPAAQLNTATQLGTHIFPGLKRNLARGLIQLYMIFWATKVHNSITYHVYFSMILFLSIYTQVPHHT